MSRYDCAAIDRVIEHKLLNQSKGHNPIDCLVQMARELEIQLWVFANDTSYRVRSQDKATKVAITRRLQHTIDLLDDYVREYRRTKDETMQTWATNRASDAVVEYHLAIELFKSINEKIKTSCEVLTKRFYDLAPDGVILYAVLYRNVNVV